MAKIEKWIIPVSVRSKQTNSCTAKESENQDSHAEDSPAVFSVMQWA